MADSALAARLLAAVRALDFGATPDSLRGGAPIAAFPSIDLALVAFGRDRPARWANVMFSREHPDGLTAQMRSPAGAVCNVRYDADLRDPAGRSLAWLPDADWSTLPFRPLQDGGATVAGTPRVVAPYPASVLKLMVAVGLGLGVDRGLLEWPAAAAPMIERSDNDATSACVALLHRHRLVDALHQRFSALGLTTLRLDGTRADGGWRNAEGAGVGRIQMTAWDTLRLLWLLDARAPAPPWLAPGTQLLAPASRDRLRGLLQGQQHDHVLSSGSLRALPGWIAGLPDAPVFAHKTGSTENYAADAGIVAGASLHAIVVLFSNLGARYAPDPRCVAPWRLPALGAALHRIAQETP